MIRRLLLGLLVTFAAEAQLSKLPPLIVENAASFSFGVAPGSLISILPTIPVPSDSRRIRVDFRSNGFGPVTARTVSGSGRVLVVPEGIPLGPATLTLVVDGIDGPTASIEVVTAAVALFRDLLVGPSRAQNVSATGQLSLNQLSNPALPGQYMILWATGLGRFREDDVRVILAGKAIRPAYAGPAPGLPGVDQINFMVPNDVPDGCYLSLSVRAGQSYSMESTIAKSASRNGCPHPLGLSQSELRALDGWELIDIGSVELRTGPPQLPPALFVAAPFPFPGVSPQSAVNVESPPVVATITANFQGLSSRKVSALAGIDRLDTVYPTCDFYGPPFVIGDGANGGGTSPVLSLKRLDGRDEQIAPLARGLYYKSLRQSPEPFFVPGVWELSMQADGFLGPFRETITLPPQIRWKDPDALRKIDRSADLPIAWETSGYSSIDIMSIELWNGLAALSPGARAVGVKCTVPAQSGHLAIPVSLLSQIGPTRGDDASGSLTLTVRPKASSLKRFPVNGDASRTAFISYSFSDELPVMIR